MSGYGLKSATPRSSVVALLAKPGQRRPVPASGRVPACGEDPQLRVGALAVIGFFVLAVTLLAATLGHLENLRHCSDAGLQAPVRLFPSLSRGGARVADSPRIRCPDRRVVRYT